MAVNWDVWENLSLMLELDSNRMDGTTYNYFVDWVANNRLAMANYIGFLEGERKFYEIREADHVNDGDGMSVDQWWRRGTYLFPNLEELRDVDVAAIMHASGFLAGRFEHVSVEGDHDYSMYLEIDQLAYLEIALQEDIDYIKEGPQDSGRNYRGYGSEVSAGPHAYPHRMPKQRMMGDFQTYNAEPVERATAAVVDDMWELFKHKDIDGLYDVLHMLTLIVLPDEPEKCIWCDGEPGKQMTECSECNGHGVVPARPEKFVAYVARCNVERRAELFKTYVSAQAVAREARIDYDQLPLSRIDHGYMVDDEDEEETEAEAEDEPTFNDTARIVADRLIAAGTRGFEPQAPHFNQRAAELHDILQRIADIGTEAVVVGLFNSVLEAGEGLEISRFSHALNYAAAYEDANLQDLNDEWTHLEENTVPGDEDELEEDEGRGDNYEDGEDDGD